MELSVVIPLIGAGATVGTIFIAIGVFKGKINTNTKVSEANAETIKTLASKKELADSVNHIDEHLEATIKRSDEMLAILKTRVEEDRATGQGQFQKFYDLINTHERRLSALEIQQTALIKSIDEFKVDLKTGFEKLQNRIDELRVAK